MVSSERAVPIAVLRDAVRRRVETSSLRQVAAEIGVSFSGLRSFMAGGKPQPKTLEKLRAWSKGQEPSEQLGLYLETSLLSMILDFPPHLWVALPADKQLTLTEMVLRLAREAFRSLEQPVPEVLAKITAEDLLRHKTEAETHGEDWRKQFLQILAGR